MADGKIQIQSTDNRIYTVTPEVGASGNVALTLPKEGGEVITGAGNQTIAGIKTFTSSPIVPTPTADMQTATKKYVDDNKIIKQTHFYSTGTLATGTGTIPIDNTTPQQTEGTQFMETSFTPLSASTSLEVDVVVQFGITISASVTIALFRDSGANAIGSMYVTPAGQSVCVSFRVKVPSTATSATTFKVRIGSPSGTTITFNGNAGSAYLNGTIASSISIKEVL